MDEKRRMVLDLFDGGEGGQSGGEAAGSTGAGETVVYGKQEENAPQDGGRGEGEPELDIPAEDGSPVTSDALEAKKREFRKLIGGEYKDLYQQEVSRALDAVCAPASLYDPVYSDGGDPLTVMDQVRDTKNTEDGWMEHITLQNAFRALNDREKQILSLRFYDGKTQMEVASALGISQAQVSRLEKGAIGAMRKSVSVS